MRSHRNNRLARLLLVLLIAAPVLVAASPASANVTRLIIYRRTCQYVSAYVVYDSFSGGSAPFYAVFQADLNSNGVFGEAGEPTSYVRLNPALGVSSLVGWRLRFPVQPEGTVIAVTAYEVDNEGRQVSGPVEPVSYPCTNRPAVDPLPANTGIIVPSAGVTATVSVEAVSVYSAPDASSTLLGGLGLGQQVTVTARNSRGDWVKIDFNGGTGWLMWQTQARLLGPYKELPIAEQ